MEPTGPSAPKPGPGDPAQRAGDFLGRYGMYLRLGWYAVGAQVAVALGIFLLPHLSEWVDQLVGRLLLTEMMADAPLALFFAGSALIVFIRHGKKQVKLGLLLFLCGASMGLLAPFNGVFGLMHMNICP